MIAKLADLFCFVLGPVITIGSLLGFVYHYDFGLGLREKSTYYYPVSFSTAKLGLGIGLALILLGILTRHRRKNESSVVDNHEER